MRLAKNALIIALVSLAMVFAVSAQTLRSPDDNRNLAPTVGTGGVVGGPTGLFLTYDGQTLRKGEYTFSIAYSNFDRDPGNADFTEIPVSFNIGLNDHLELFFTTDAYRGVKVNNPQNLSGFYLPNSQLPLGTLPAAIILAPGTSGGLSNRAVYRPAGMPFAQFPYTGGSAGSYGLNLPAFSGSAIVFGNNLGANALLGPPRAGGAADLFPGVGSAFGGILPGFVLSTQALTCANGSTCGSGPLAYSSAPSYLPDAPFINRRYGTSSFSTYNAGLKWRFSSPESAFGWGVVAFYRWYNDTASDFAGFNQLQRGASPGGNRGDIGVGFFADSRAATWANVSANATYIYNSSVKGEFPNGTFTLLDRPDEFRWGAGVDFPVNKYFQPMLEYGQTVYTGGRTPNVFENNPLDILAGVRIYPARWWGMGFAYRYHANSQDDTDDARFVQNAQTLDYPTSIITNGLDSYTSSSGSIVPFQTLTASGPLTNVFRTSTDPHGFIVQMWVGRRNARAETTQPKELANVTSIDFDQSEVILPCPPGTRSASNGCNDDRNVGVRTSTENPSGDPLTYNYTVSGGRIVGSGAGVNWDLSGVKAGTYTITSAVDNGCGFCGKTQTKTITVKECPDCKPICNCPTSTTVTGPSGLTQPGQSMTFTANINGGTQDNPSYNWTVSGGEIASGQGTSAITVNTDDSMQGRTVTATVEIGNLCAECRSGGSASGEVAVKEEKKVAKKVGDQGPANDDEVKAFMMNIRDTEFNADPTGTLYLINTGNAKAKAKRVKQLNKAIDFLGMDKTRIRIVDGGESGRELTEYWMVPAGAEPPM